MKSISIHSWMCSCKHWLLFDSPMCLRPHLADKVACDGAAHIHPQLRGEGRLVGPCQQQCTR
jgi:hypothetical protein